jgi:hypothetical protein
MDNFIAGLLIFQKYGDTDFSAEHDVIYAGDAERDYTPEELEIIDGENTGWHKDEYLGCFYYFT